MPKAKRKITWKTVQIPEELEAKIDNAVKGGRFVSRAEFVRNAIRWYLDALEKGELP